jgi:hypothetical protein
MAEAHQMYTCLTPCTPQGCPGHIATLSYQGTEEPVTFQNGRTTIVELSPADLKVLCRLLFRAEGVNFEELVKDAREDLKGDSGKEDNEL